MDFNMTEGQKLLQKTVREFTKAEIEPRAKQIDREGRLPDDLIKKMSKLRLLGMIFPPEHGGIGASSLDCLLAIEQVAYSGTGAWWLVGFTNSIPGCIVRFGSEEQKSKYLRPVCDGDVYPSIQFTEADTGSDPRALNTRAIPDGDYYVINGVKRFSTFGAREGYAILYVKDETGKCTAFIVEKDGTGYSANPAFELMGGGGIEAVDVYFDDLKVPEKNLLGVKGEALKILLFWISDEKVQQSGACLGIAQAALDEAKGYAASRIVRGKPQAGLQGIRWMLAEMHSRLEAARWLTYRAAFIEDQRAADLITEAATTKIFVVPATMEVVEMARRIHGAYGYVKEFKIERLYRAIAGASAIAVSLEINKSIVSDSLTR